MLRFFSKMNHEYNPRYRPHIFRRSDLLTSPPSHIKHVATYARALSKEAFQHYLKSPDSFEWLAQVLQDLAETIRPELGIKICKFEVPVLGGINKLAKRAQDTLGASYYTSNLYYLLLESDGHGGVGHFLSLSRLATTGKEQTKPNKERRMRLWEACKFFIVQPILWVHMIQLKKREPKLVNFFE